MKSSVVFVLIGLTAASAILALDLSRVRKAKEVIDHVYLRVETQPSESQSNFLAKADHELTAITSKIWILPKGPIKSAESEISLQLFTLGLTLETLSVFGADQIGEKLAGEACDKYAQKIPEFKRRLEYIRRTL